MKFKKAVKVHLDEGTTMRVLFSDGVTKRYDIMQLAKRFPQLKALKDRKLFLKGRIESWDGVMWNDELDVSSDTIYEDGKTVDTEIGDLAALLGFHIKEFRLYADLTQEELAKKVHIDQGDLSRIEKGTANPSIKTIARILNGLNANLNIRIG